MACQITFGSERVLANNSQFSSLIDLAIEVGNESCRDPAERTHVERMKRLSEEEFWPGRGIAIETDFPDLAERKFWARVFYDTARAIFERRVGIHEHVFWQAQRIWQAYGVGELFEQAVRTLEPVWSASSRDHDDFQRIVNGRSPASETT